MKKFNLSSSIRLVLFAAITLSLSLPLISCSSDDLDEENLYMEFKSAQSLINPAIFWGPEIIQANTKKGISYIIGSSELDLFDKCFNISVENIDPINIVSSVTIKIDGRSLGNFNFKTTSIVVKAICGIKNNSKIDIQVKGKDGSGIKVWIEGDLLPLVDNRDGNKYKTIKIGNQIWMAENLAYLPSVSPSAEGSETDPYFYVYNYQGIDVEAAKATENYKTFGVLYNLSATLAGESISDQNPSGIKGVCPDGWHIPSDAEWTQLENYLITNGYNYDETTSENKIAKSLASPTHWIPSSEIGAIGNDLSINNKSGFSALPGGDRDAYSGIFDRITRDGGWWSVSSTLPYYRYLVYYNSYIGRGNHNKAWGFSVRCVKD